MSKALKYTNKETSWLAMILAEAFGADAEGYREDLNICSKRKREGFEEEVEFSDNISKKMKRASSVLVGGGSKMKKKKEYKYVMEIFNENYEVGSIERDGILSRVRAKRKKNSNKDDGNMTSVSVKKDTKKRLSSLRDEERFKNMNFNTIISGLIDYYYLPE